MRNAVLFWCRIGHAKEHHGEGKHLLGLEVVIVDPEPGVRVLTDTKASGGVDFALWIRIRPWEMPGGAALPSSYPGNALDCCDVFGGQATRADYM